MHAYLSPHYLLAACFDDDSSSWGTDPTVVVSTARTDTKYKQGLFIPRRLQTLRFTGSFCPNYPLLGQMPLPTC